MRTTPKTPGTTNPMNPMLRLRRSPFAAALVCALTFTTAACDVSDLLEVDPVDTVPAEGLTTPANAELLVNGAIADFECAFGGYVALSAVIAGEMTDATPTASRWPADRRRFDTPSDEAQYATAACTGLGTYVPLSTARWSAENILTALQGWTEQELADFGFDREELIAKAAVYAGYSYVLMAEGFCSMAIDLSAEMTPDQVFQRALDHFETAVAAAQAAGLDDILNLARVGQARAYRGLNDGAAAVAAAQQVPAGFVYEVDTSVDFSVRNNRIFAQNGPPPLGGTALSVGEEYRAFQHYGVDDPRVAVSEFQGMDDDGLTPLYYQLKYDELDAPIRLASYDEAQLIIAEFQGGTTAESIISDFHAAAGLPAVDFSGLSAEQILEHVIEERQAVLWLEGHRFEDVERFDLTRIPAVGAEHRKGLTYGDARCFPLPDVEIRNNPNV